MKRIIRVFPRKTNATPDDDLAIVGREPDMFDAADEVHISVTFTWDMPIAEKLEKAWRYVAPTKIGGVATGEKSGEFVSGMYVKKGYVITSRGCPNKCWFCSVWKREGSEVRELPICDGWNILDDNLLACSESHINAVFDMLKRRPRTKPPSITGGLEAKRLKLWQAKRLKEINFQSVYFAYDTPDDLEPLHEARKILTEAGFSENSHVLRCYVLCGYKGDTFENAEKRLKETLSAGYFPMAMLYKDNAGASDIEWRRFQRIWARPISIFSNSKKIKEGLEDGNGTDKTRGIGGRAAAPDLPR